jgi:hypothetical protein
MNGLNRYNFPFLKIFGVFGAMCAWMSAAQAALPTRTTPLSAEQAKSGKTLLREIKDGKVSSPEFESDLAELNRLEAKFLESGDQLERLKNRNRPKGTRVAAPGRSAVPKKGVRK